MKVQRSKMSTISAGASFKLHIQFAQYESIEPSFYGGWTEEVPEDWTDEQKRARIKEIQLQVRDDIERLIDDDIEDVRGLRLFELIGPKGKRKYPENKSTITKEKK
jgi:hypothetical protein